MLRHPILAPGLRVVDRGRGLLQIGITADRCAVLTRSAANTRLVEALLARDTLPDDPEARSTLDELVAAGLVVDADAEQPVRARIAVHGDLGAAASDLDPGALLDAAGLARHDPSAADPGDAALVLSRGELDRDLLDPLLRSRTTHIAVRLVDGAAVLGPLVVPGVTACLRCLDEHRADEDPGHHAVVTRYAAASGRPRPDAVADPVDPLLAVLLTSWALHDLAGHLGGARPATWSTTITVDGALSGMVAARWLRHPGCACGWTDEAAPEDARPSGRLAG
ncbi:TOMM precursor leader peptide-binding protein [Nocardioides terrisoli]|uniref:TOMM precursor leader peptide-binding protein n=1 Tax=Nocardioides terrisoli TaxID=3388267 RepID=UPI00287B6FFD|nr:TOMM precursor leader peptide-binding protein [Nocardioides marmorisolisilvae]